MQLKSVVFFINSAFFVFQLVCTIGKVSISNISMQHYTILVCSKIHVKTKMMIQFLPANTIYLNEFIIKNGNNLY